MNRAARWALFYLVLSMAAVLSCLVLAFPPYPSTALGGLTFFALPIPAVLAGDWLFEYRPLKFLRPIDEWAIGIEKSPHRLLLIICLIGISGAIGLALIALLS